MKELINFKIEVNIMLGIWKCVDQMDTLCLIHSSNQFSSPSLNAECINQSIKRV